jgi:ribonuclease R
LGKKKLQDPHAKREANQYDNPIASRELIMQMMRDCDEPLEFDEIADALHIDTADNLEALRRRLIAMLRDGQLIKNRSDKFGLLEKMDVLRGRVQGHADGHGFLICEGQDKDLFISGKQMRLVFHGDVVLATKMQFGGRGRPEAKIVRVLERNTPMLVGRYFHEHQVGFVVPANSRITQDIIVDESDGEKAKPGELVTLEIIEHPTMRYQAVGRIIEVLGEHMAPGIEVDVAIRSHQIPHVWPEAALQEATKFDSKVISDKSSDRVDLRDLPFVTIDGVDAEDFDDAVFCEPNDQSGWTLYVAIADVSHYVKPGSALDQEALVRGNSVYFPSRVVPMLPEALSNGLCSLMPQVDRLVFVCQMTISEKGEATSYEFYPAIIHSHARLTYTEVAAFLNGDKDAHQKLSNLSSELHELKALYQALRAARKASGMIQFELAEPRVVFDADQKIESLVPIVRNVAHMMIEEYMLAANVCAAKCLLSAKFAGVFRVHPKPKLEKIEALRQYLKEVGVTLGGGKSPEPKDYASVLSQIADRPDRHVLQSMLLRSLSQAYYDVKNEGHFGLAFDAYTHFTSPIRRYPDLMVHRLLQKVLSKHEVSADEQKSYEAAVTHCSITERRADDATREVMSWLKCEFLMDKVGNTYPGVITTVTSFGFFVELKDIYVDGLVHVSNLKNGYYEYDAMRHRLVAENTGVVHAMGDEVEVQVARVDLDQRQIDFELISHESSVRKRRKRK